MTYAEELKERYTAARKRLGMLPTVPIVRIPEIKFQSEGEIMPRRTVIREPEPFSKSDPLTAKHLVAITADAACMPVKMLIGDHRNHNLVMWRHAMIYVICTLRPDLGYSAIGRTVNRDHSVIMYAEKKVTKNFQNYTRYIDLIVSRINPALLIDAEGADDAEG